MKHLLKSLTAVGLGLVVAAAGQAKGTGGSNSGNNGQSHNQQKCTTTPVHNNPYPGKVIATTSSGNYSGQNVVYTPIYQGNEKTGTNTNNYKVKLVGPVGKPQDKTPNYYLKNGDPFVYKGQTCYIYHGPEHYHWSTISWSNDYGCYLYYDPWLHQWYYWCAPKHCYFPIVYHPYGFVATEVVVQPTVLVAQPQVVITVTPDAPPPLPPLPSDLN